MTAPNIKVKVQKKLTLKLKVLPRFPSSVTVDSPLTLSRAGGNYDIGLDVTALESSLDAVYAKLAAANTFTAGPQTITPPANSLTQGVVVTQTGPTSGTTAGPFSYNVVNVTDGNNVISAGASPDAFDTGSGNSVAFRANYTASADNVNPRIGGSFNVLYTGTSTVAQPVGLFGSTYTNGRVQSSWGVIGYTSVGPLGRSDFLFPVVSEVSAQTGSSVQYRSAYVAYTEAPVQGSVIDAVLTVTGFNVGRGTPGGFKNVIALSDFLGGSPPLDTTANFFWSQSAFTIGSFANLPNITVTGNILNFPKMAINGAGRAIFGGAIASLSASFTIQAGDATTSIVGIGTTGNTTTGSANVTLVSSTTASQMILFANEANRTTVRYGITLGSWNEISTFAGNGLIIGTNNAKPIVLGINNAEVARLSESTPGQFNLGVAGSVVGKLSFGNATSGTQSITPATGALGTGVSTLPAGTYNLLGDSTTATLTNKTLDTAGAGNSLKVNGVDIATAWTAYTPTVSATSGTFTTVSATGRYKQIGKTIHMQADVTMTNVGTAVTNLQITLPFTAASNVYIGAAREHALTGKSGAAIIQSGGSVAIAIDATGATFIANGNVVAFGITYEIP